MRVLVFDPSGNFKEGDGTTGWAFFNCDTLLDFGDIKSDNFACQELYWLRVGQLISEFQADVVVCESYRLFAHKAKEQSWSQLETPQLIGYLRMICWHKGIAFIFQDPSDKTRVADPILVREGVFEKRGNNYYCNGKKTNLHMRDAIRHGIFYHRYRKGKENAKN